jgi:hypothetical protein
VGLQWGLLYAIETIIQTQNTENNSFRTVKTRRLIAINWHIQHSSLPYCDVKAWVMFDENICQLFAPARQHSTHFSGLLVRTALNCRIFCAWKSLSLPFASRQFFLLSRSCTCKSSLCKLVPCAEPRPSERIPISRSIHDCEHVEWHQTLHFLSNYSCHSLASDQDMVSA